VHGAVVDLDLREGEREEVANCRHCLNNCLRCPFEEERVFIAKLNYVSLNSFSLACSPR
jgi:hypothetical protein